MFKIFIVFIFRFLMVHLFLKNFSTTSHLFHILIIILFLASAICHPLSNWLDFIISINCTICYELDYVPWHWPVPIFLAWYFVGAADTTWGYQGIRCVTSYPSTRCRYQAATLPQWERVAPHIGGSHLWFQLSGLQVPEGRGYHTTCEYIA